MFKKTKFLFLYYYLIENFIYNSKNLTTVMENFQIETVPVGLDDTIEEIGKIRKIEANINGRQLKGGLLKFPDSSLYGNYLKLSYNHKTEYIVNMIDQTTLRVVDVREVKDLGHLLKDIGGNEQKIFSETEYYIALLRKEKWIITTESTLEKYARENNAPFTKINNIIYIPEPITNYIRDTVRGFKSKNIPKNTLIAAVRAYKIEVKNIFRLINKNSSVLGYYIEFRKPVSRDKGRYKGIAAIIFKKNYLKEENNVIECLKNYRESKENPNIEMNVYNETLEGEYAISFIGVRSTHIPYNFNEDMKKKGFKVLELDGKHETKKNTLLNALRLVAKTNRDIAVDTPTNGWSEERILRLTKPLVQLYQKTKFNQKS